MGKRKGMDQKSSLRKLAASLKSANTATNASLPKKASEASSNWKKLSAASGFRSPTKQRVRHVVLNQLIIPAYDNGGKTEGLLPSKRKTDVVLNQFNFPAYDINGACKTEGLLPSEYTKDTWCLAMDCEMVGVGPMNESSLARVSIVNEKGFCLYDKYVQPLLAVTDYRTAVSGIREEHLVNAPSIQTVMREVAKILHGHVLVGHALGNDMKVIFLRHPRHKTRDTSNYFGRGNRKPGLRMLTKKLLNVEIQHGEHNSIEDAQAAMKLYLTHRKEWEESLQKK